MKLKYCLVFSLFSLSSFVSAQNIETPSFGELPQPISGIHIVPDSQLHSTIKLKSEMLSRMKQEKEKGYFEIDSPNAKALISVKYLGAEDIKNSKNYESIYDTHMKASYTEINLAFPFKEILSINKSDIIGYAPAGSYKNGWTGIGEFFSNNSLGVCSLTFYNIALSHGGALIGESSVKYLVNKKSTVTSIEGSVNSGFIYKINWYDDTFIHELECANMNFQKEIIYKMIILANKIDKE